MAATLGTGVDRLLLKYGKLFMARAVVMQAAAAALPLRLRPVYRPFGRAVLWEGRVPAHPFLSLVGQHRAGG